MKFVIARGAGIYFRAPLTFLGAILNSGPLGRAPQSGVRRGSSSRNVFIRDLVVIAVVLECLPARSVWESVVIAIGVILNLFQDLPFGAFVIVFLAVLCKGVVSFFFFVKILINCGGRTRMYPPYKNAYKRPFCLNIKALKRRKSERFYEYFILVVILESRSPGSVVL